LTMSCPIFWIKNDAGKYLPTPFSVEPFSAGLEI